MAGAVLAGFPFWELRFGADGKRILTDDANSLLRAAGTGEITDLLIFAHDWNNDRAKSASLYARFFCQLAAVAGDAGVTGPIGAAGVSWPSVLWPGDGPEDDRDGNDPLAALHALYPDPVSQAAVDTALALLRERREDDLALQRFQGLLALLAEGPEIPLEDDGKAALVDRPAAVAFTAMAAIDPAAHGAATGYARMWAGAERALRATSYYQMKKRAGSVAVAGLAPLLVQLLDQLAAPRIHLIGHSTGARLIAYTLRGLEAGRRVHSVTLLQGAFSHFAFAESLPFAPGRSGGLAGRQRRVDGPILVTHSRHDFAIGRRYARASMIGCPDGGAGEDPGYRCGAMGHDGAQCCEAIELLLRAAGHDYAFRPGEIFNLDASDVIKTSCGRPGAHHDIVHPELAWAVLRAAALA